MCLRITLRVRSTQNFWVPSARVSASEGLGWGLRIRISDGSQGLQLLLVLDYTVGTTVLEAGGAGQDDTGEGHRVCPQADQVQVLLCWVTLGNSLYCSDPHFPHL